MTLARVGARDRHFMDVVGVMADSGHVEERLRTEE